jgi:hypothetical protein
MDAVGILFASAVVLWNGKSVSYMHISPHENISFFTIAQCTHKHSLFVGSWRTM